MHASLLRIGRATLKGVDLQGLANSLGTLSGALVGATPALNTLGRTRWT